MDIANLKKSVDLSDGEWVDDIQDHPGLRLKVRSIRYKPYRVAASAKMRKGGKRFNTDEGAIEAGVALGGPLGDHILLDWDGVTSKGKAVKYSPQVAASILTADDDVGIGQSFRDAVYTAASEVADRIAAATEEAAGN